MTAQETTPDKRVRDAADAFQDIMATHDKGVPRDLFDKAQCIVIVPGLKKGAFMVGGKYGRGFVSCRAESGWTAPAAVRIEGGSFGLQLGGSSTDLILLVMNQRGMNRLLGDKFTIGGEAATVAGPVGRDASLNTDVLLRTEIFSWSRSRGAFAGLSLEGATLRPDPQENRRLYGRDITNKEILQAGVRTPAAAQPLIAGLNRYSNLTGSASRSDVGSLRESGGRVSMGEDAIRFGTGKSAIPQGAEPALSEIATTLKEHPEWKVRVEGYTDNVGTRSANRTLAEQRAHAVVTWLSAHGVDRNRLAAKGYGEDRPIADNASDRGRAQNRRVEIVRE